MKKKHIKRLGHTGMIVSLLAMAGGPIGLNYLHPLKPKPAVVEHYEATKSILFNTRSELEKCVLAHEDLTHPDARAMDFYVNPNTPIYGVLERNNRLIQGLKIEIISLKNTLKIMGEDSVRLAGLPVVDWYYNHVSEHSKIKKNVTFTSFLGGLGFLCSLAGMNLYKKREEN